MAAHIKLPENLRSWKIISRLPDDNGNSIYKVSKKDYDGTVINGLLRYVLIKGEEYNIDNTDFINEEAAFLKTISQLGECFNYLDICVNNNPAKKKIEFFIVTEELKTLFDILKLKAFNEEEIIDFGIQMSSILEKLENNSIYHGNINPENIYISAEGKYKLGGFSDFESKISDMSYIAPEISKKESADFTTDIYSLGLIMYSMSNNGKIPFETESVSREDAIKLRFDGKSVSAPSNGSEKLKSVVVIACQANKDNRWKNAVNIKNALTSIKNEIFAQAQNDAVIIPETTDFDENVFEEYEYENFDDTAKSSAEVLPVTGAVFNEEDMDDAQISENEAAETADVTVDNQEQTEPAVIEASGQAQKTENDENSATQNNSTVKSDTHESIDSVTENTVSDNSVTDNTDDFNVKSKVMDFGGESLDDNEPKEEKSFNDKVKEKDYGSFFDDYEPISVEDNADKNSSKSYAKEIDDYDVFESDEDAETTEKKKKKNTAVIVISIIVMLAALGFIAYCIISGLSNGGNNKNTTASSTQATEATQSTTAKATTEPQTTVAPTTESSETEVIGVVGYGYSYAKKLLEEDGFVVEIGKYDYSDEWPEGYVIAQSPSGNSKAESGSVVTLDISLGIREPETTAKPAEVEETKSQSSQSSATDSSYIFADSASAYLSEAEIAKLSDNELTLALNEIYARRGRIFSDSSISEYFNSKTWYTPKYTADEFSQNVTFNSYEQANLQLMVDEQKERGLR